MCHKVSSLGQYVILTGSDEALDALSKISFILLSFVIDSIVGR